MAWSLDWFAAAEKAREGSQIRRAGWTYTLELDRGVWYVVEDNDRRIVKATDYDEDDLRARDWTDEGFDADICGATPAYNTAGHTYRNWDSKINHRPPPIPSFSEPEE